MTALHLALAAVALACALDVATTVLALRRGFVEANDIVAWLMRTLGDGWWAMKALLTGALAWALVTADSVAGLWVVAVVTAAAALHNIRLMRRKGK